MGIKEKRNHESYLWCQELVTWYEVCSQCAHRKKIDSWNLSSPNKFSNHAGDKWRINMSTLNLTFCSVFFFFSFSTYSRIQTLSPQNNLPPRWIPLYGLLVFTIRHYIIGDWIVSSLICYISVDNLVLLLRLCLWLHILFLRFDSVGPMLILSTFLLFEPLSYLPTPPLGQDMTQGQFLSGI